MASNSGVMQKISNTNKIQNSKFTKYYPTQKHQRFIQMEYELATPQVFVNPTISFETIQH